MLISMKDLEMKFLGTVGRFPFSQLGLEQDHRIVIPSEDGGVAQTNLPADLISYIVPYLGAVHGGENPGEHGTE